MSKIDATSAASETQRAGTRPGGRATKVVAAIHKAALELLAERGYAGVEIPEIAARAGVNRTTIYRRWPSKPDLMLDIMLSEMRAKVPTPDTGSFEGDLAQLLASIAEVLMQPLTQDLFHAFAMRRDIDPDYEAMRSAFWEERFAVSGNIVARAIARGEIPAGASPRDVLEAGSAPLYFRILALGETVDAGAIAALAKRVARQDFTDFPQSL